MVPWFAWRFALGRPRLAIDMIVQEITGLDQQIGDLLEAGMPVPDRVALMGEREHQGIEMELRRERQHLGRRKNTCIGTFGG